MTPNGPKGGLPLRYVRSQYIKLLRTKQKKTSGNRKLDTAGAEVRDEMRQGKARLNPVGFFNFFVRKEMCMLQNGDARLQIELTKLVKNSSTNCESSFETIITYLDE